LRAAQHPLGPDPAGPDHRSKPVGLTVGGHRSRSLGWLPAKSGAARPTRSGWRGNDAARHCAADDLPQTMSNGASGSTSASFSVASSSAR